MEEKEKLAQVVRTWGGHACPSTNRWRRVLDKDNFNSNDVTRKLAEIQTKIWSINQDKPFCGMVPSFCSPICCPIPGLSYRKDCWCRVKIILHRIISVVWLTNFPSEIRRLTSPRWWAVPLFPEREKVWGPAFGWEPCIDDRLPLPCALAKEKMPAEWLLNSNLGLLKSFHMMSSNHALWSLTHKYHRKPPEAAKGPRLTTRLNSPTATSVVGLLSRKGENMSRNDRTITSNVPTLDRSCVRGEQTYRCFW